MYTDSKVLYVSVASYVHAQGVIINHRVTSLKEPGRASLTMQSPSSFSWHSSV